MLPLEVMEVLFEEVKENEPITGWETLGRWIDLVIEEGYEETAGIAPVGERV